jgi:hypothetical protein
MPKNDDLTAEERELLPLIEDLGKMYDTRTQDELDLGAIREQIGRAAALPAVSATTGKAFQRASDQENQDVSLHPSRLRSRRTTSRSSSLSILAATLISLLLTGSFISSLLLARSHQSATTTQSAATSKGSLQALTPCDRPYPITGTIISVQFHHGSIGNATAFGSAMVKGPQEQFHGLLSGNFMVFFLKETRVFEQQQKGCHAVSLTSLQVGQRIQIQFDGDIMQSLPPQIVADQLVIVADGRSGS